MNNKRKHPFDLTDEELSRPISGIVVKYENDTIYFQEDMILDGYWQPLDLKLFQDLGLTPTTEWIGRKIEIQWKDDNNLLSVKLMTDSYWIKCIGE